MLGLFLSLVFATPTVFAQSENAYYEMANLYHQRAHAFACESVSKAVNEIKSKSEAEVQAEMGSDEPELKQKVISGLEAICNGGRRAMLGGSRVLSLTNGAILNAAATPFASAISFFRGFYDRKHSELGPRTDFLYRVMGPKKSVEMYVIGNLASQLPFLIFKPSSMIPGLNVSLGIEMITNYRCYHVNELNEEQVRFCKNYQTLKNFFYQASEKSFAAGKKLQHRHDQKVMAKRESLTVSDYCALSVKEQVQRARLALQRYPIFQDARVATTEILPPVHKNTCTKILIQAEKAETLAALKSELTPVEGIEILSQVKGDFPKDLFYTEAELKAMPYENQLCQDVLRMNYMGYSNPKAALLSDFLKSSLAPELLASPEHREVVVPDELLRKGNTENLRNLVFSIGLPASEQTTIEAAIEERKTLVSELKGDYKLLVNSEDYSECQARVKKFNLSMNEFKTKLERVNEISAMKAVQTYQEQKVVEHFFKKKARRLKLHWELISTNDLQTVSAALASNTVANIVVLSHGKPGGHLVDSKNQEFPNEAFANIAPSVLSLNFYSCYSHELIQLYHLDQRMQSSASFYKIRYLTTVKQNHFLAGESFAPIAGFDDYLYQVDHFLNRSVKGAALVQENFGSSFSMHQSPATCVADVSSIQVEKGTYAVILNDQYLGTVSAGISTPPITYPCSLLQSAQNTLKIKNVINSGGSRISNINSLSLKFGDQEIKSAQASFKSNSLIIFKF